MSAAIAAFAGSSLTPSTSNVHLQSSGSLPSGTTSLLFVLSSTKKAGTSNDGYADNLVFDLSPTSVSTVPLPAGMPLFLTGGALFGLIARRGKKKHETLASATA